MVLKKRSLFIFLLYLSFISCNRDNFSVIQGVFNGGAGMMLYLDRLDINRVYTLDSLRVRKNDSFRFRIRSNHPHIYMIRNNNERFLTLLPFPGERIEIKGNYAHPGNDYEINGSLESEKIQSLHERLSETRSKLRALDESIEKAASITDSQALEYLNRRKELINDQRSFSIHFIIENLRSISSIYAIYQTFDQDHLVLGENRDIQYMKILADSLSIVYPDVPLVEAFVNDARSAEQRYYNLIGLSQKMTNIQEGLPDIVLPDINGQSVSLSSLRGKTVLLYFWASYSNHSRQYNPSLHNLYRQFKNRGFEVYAVSMDTRREAWERAIRFDELDWINVSGLENQGSSFAATYNVTNIPTNFLINTEGEIIARDLYGRELEKWLNNILN